MLPRELRALAAGAVCSAATDEEDLDALLDGPQAASPSQGWRRVPGSSGEDLAAPRRLQVTPVHLDAALEAARKRAASAIGAPTVPDVRCTSAGVLLLPFLPQQRTRTTADQIEWKSHAFWEGQRAAVKRSHLL